ncbi:MAG: enoyl-CoA hydratase/isomerase family protein [Salibacteraceae bacterium]
MSYNNILVEVANAIMRITINRPKQLNALNGETIAELSAAFKAGESNDEVRTIIVTGTGDKAFVAGADIKEFAEFSVEEGRELSRKGHQNLFDLVEGLKTPVIAAINGYCLGGGLELAMACHIRVASDNAMMGLPEVSLGVIPGYGGTQRLTQLVGKGKALELIMTAGMMKAEEAKEWGLVNHITFQNELIGMAEKIAGRIAKNSPKAIGLAIEAVNAGQVDGVNGFNVEIEKFGEAFGTEDFKIGTQAFLNKEKPSFSGK